MEMETLCLHTKKKIKNHTIYFRSLYGLDCTGFWWTVLHKYIRMHPCFPMQSIYLLNLSLFPLSPTHNKSEFWIPNPHLKPTHNYTCNRGHMQPWTTMRSNTTMSMQWREAESSCYSRIRECIFGDKSASFQFRKIFYAFYSIEEPTRFVGGAIFFFFLNASAFFSYFCWCCCCTFFSSSSCCKRSWFLTKLAECMHNIEPIHSTDDAPS